MPGSPPRSLALPNRYPAPPPGEAPPGVGSVIEFRFNDKGFNAMKVLELSPGNS
jgi:hypothetical protein